MKKTIAMLLTTLFLTSCGGTPEAEQTTSGLQVIDKKEFSISIPEKWTEVIDLEKRNFNPKYGKEEFIALSSDMKYKFTSNIIIMSQDINKNITSKDYSISNNVGANREYLEYLKLDSKTIKFADKDETEVYIFEAKYNIETPKLKYLQFGKICNVKRAFFITIAVGQDTKDMDPYLEFAKTFACK